MALNDSWQCHPFPETIALGFSPWDSSLSRGKSAASEKATQDLAPSRRTCLRGIRCAEGRFKRLSQVQLHNTFIFEGINLLNAPALPCRPDVIQNNKKLYHIFSILSIVKNGLN
jgi:hypothetical protein